MSMNFFLPTLRDVRNSLQMAVNESCHYIDHLGNRSPTGDTCPATSVDSDMSSLMCQDIALGS